MSTRNIPAEIIIKSFFWVGTAADISANLNRRWGAHSTAASLREAWASAAETNVIMRECGERPVYGFEQTDKIVLAQRIAA